MTLFDRFRKKQQVGTVANFFDFPRNDEGIKQVIAWLKQAENLWVCLDEEENLTIYADADGQKSIYAFTDVIQMQASPMKGSRLVTTNYAGLKTIFEQYEDIASLKLNPYTDGIQLNRQVFTPHHVIPKQTKILLGLPEKKSVAVIELLKAYASEDSSIEKIYLALMNCNGEFSYAVLIKSEFVESIVPKVGERINELCQKQPLLYPVDFIYSDLIEEAQYLIYER